MIIARIKCDNMYMFKDFDFDLSYKKKGNHSLTEYDTLESAPRVNIRKNIIIMGANASGKTTFGQLLIAIISYMVNLNPINIKNIIRNIEEDASFEIEFISKDNCMYRLKAVFDKTGLKEEVLAWTKLYPSYNITAHRRKLDTTKHRLAYIRTIEEGNNNYFSKILNDDNNIEIIHKIMENSSGIINLSGIMSNLLGLFDEATDVELLNKILPEVDISIDKVERLPEVENSYVIRFKNDIKPVIIQNNDLSNLNRLSQGTVESIAFANILSIILDKKRCAGVFYVDEKLSHMHSELELYLVRKAILYKQPNDQLFLTSHNSDIFDLNVPNNAYVIFKRDDNGFIYPSFVTDYVNQNDRRLKNYYENDYFEALPMFSALDNLVCED